MKIFKQMEPALNTLFDEGKWRGEDLEANLSAGAVRPGVAGGLYSRLQAVLTDLSLNCELATLEARSLTGYAAEIRSKIDRGQIADTAWASGAVRRLGEANSRILALQDEAERLARWIVQA